MICAVQISRVPVGRVCLVGDEKMGILVVKVLRHAVGYTEVAYASLDKANSRSFRDSSGALHEFNESGFKRTEWSTNTLVRPVVLSKGEKKMASEVADGLVDDEGVSTDTKKKISKLTKKAAKVQKTAKGKVKKEKAPPKPKGDAAKVNDCECGCGGKTARRFCPGHDARYYGWMRKVVDGRMKISELPASLGVRTKAQAEKILAQHG